jgi:hypothetical protein
MLQAFLSSLDRHRPTSVARYGTAPTMWPGPSSSVERETGFEPATVCLEGRYATTALLPHSRAPFRPSALAWAKPGLAGRNYSTQLSGLQPACRPQTDSGHNRHQPKSLSCLIGARDVKWPKRLGCADSSQGLSAWASIPVEPRTLAQVLDSSVTAEIHLSWPSMLDRMRTSGQDNPKSGHK